MMSRFIYLFGLVAFIAGAVWFLVTRSDINFWGSLIMSTLWEILWILDQGYHINVHVIKDKEDQ